MTITDKCAVYKWAHYTYQTFDFIVSKTLKFGIFLSILNILNIKKVFNHG
jgi:hypothetical protein